MDETKGTDLSQYIVNSCDIEQKSDSSSISLPQLERSMKSPQSPQSIQRVPSLPQLKPHFIVKEYCGRPRRESQTLYLKETVKHIPDTIDNIDDSIDNKTSHYTSKNKSSVAEKVALLGGAIVGGMIGLYIYGKSSND